MSETKPLVFEEDSVVIKPGRFFPLLAIDLELRADGWYSSMVCCVDRGGVEVWRGPYVSRESAERNAAAFGRDFLRARGLRQMATALTTHYHLPAAV